MLDCIFCKKVKIKEEGTIIDEEKERLWYAFVSIEPEIFGHIIVTYSNYGENCIHAIWEKYGELEEEQEEGYRRILNSMIEGVRIMSYKMMKIKKVERVYVVMAGEDPSVHIHFHLFPRYEFRNNDEIAEWAKKNRLEEGEDKWKLFYAYPTKNFCFHRGFSYLGEIERKYNDWKWYQMENKPPSKELLKEMTEKLKAKMGYT